MRDQYAGDVSDFLKIAFLRALAGNDRTLGIAWYYGRGLDGRADGRHLEWQREPAWQRLDRCVHGGLSSLRERSVSALEDAPVWPPGALFHRDPMPSRFRRNEWGERTRVALDGADIVFLDPDNGLGKGSSKHATYSELRLMRRPGRALVFITFPGRNMPHATLVRRLHGRLATEADVKDSITLRTNVSVPSSEGSRYCVQRQRWFTVVDPDPELRARVRVFTDALASVPRVKARLEGDQ